MSRNSVLYLKSRKCIGKPVRFLFVLVLPCPLARALSICHERGGDVAREDLIPFSERSKEEAKEYGKKGGIASGAARRRKRSLKEAAESLTHYLHKMQDRTVSYNVIRRDNLFSRENQEIIFTMSQ